MPSGAVNPNTKQLIYSDLNYTFTPHPVTGKLPVLKNEEAVKRAIKNLILTNRFERPYEPLFGGNILALLFENSDPFLEFNIKKQIETTIKNFEPRAILRKVDVVSIEERNEVQIDILFSIANQKNPVELTVILERVR